MWTNIALGACDLSLQIVWVLIWCWWLNTMAHLVWHTCLHMECGMINRSYNHWHDFSLLWVQNKESLTDIITRWFIISLRDISSPLNANELATIAHAPSRDQTAVNHGFGGVWHLSSLADWEHTPVISEHLISISLLQLPHMHTLKVLKLTVTLAVLLCYRTSQ